MKRQINWTLMACIVVLTGGAAVTEGSAAGTMKPLRSVQFSPDGDVKCVSSALETGDPKTGPSTWILKAPAGCLIPWHFHTAQEQLIIVSGSVLAEMTDHPPTRLVPGGFAVMAGHMAHQFACRGKSACLMFVTFDAAYDIFWGKGAGP
jgi:hypothetical protein